MSSSPQSPPIRALEFYSGIGGLHLAFSRSNVGGAVVQAFDWDQNACHVYNANYHPNIAKKLDIATLTSTQLAALHADLWLLSPACQPYTVLNPNAKGASDPRAKSFLHLVKDVLPEMHASNTAPSYLLIENVAGFETSSTRRILLHTLQSLRYYVRELLLTPLQFGIPNSRLRYYLLARKHPFNKPDSNRGEEPDLFRSMPGFDMLESNNKDLISDNLDSVMGLRPFLDHPTAPPNSIPDKVLERWGRLFDIVLPEARRTCCFTRGYTQLVERAGSVLQMNENLDTTNTFDQFLRAQEGGRSDAVRILDSLQLRYFSPEELLRIFDFNRPGQEPAFKWPEGISTKTKYRLIGNSVNSSRIATWKDVALSSLVVDALRSSKGKRTTEDMGLEAATKALLDAGITYDAIETAYVGYCYGDSTSGQRALYNLGLTYIPIVNVNNNCSTGSSALYQANNAVKYGQVECAMALGFERMKPGSLGTNFPDRVPPMALFHLKSEELESEGLGENHGPGAPRMFGNGAQEYFEKFGGGIEHLAMIASKNHKHSMKNPYSQFRDGWSVEQVLKAPKITKQLTKFMCSPTSDGAACCIVASEDFVHKHGLENQAIEIVAQALTTDGVETFEGRSAMDVVGFGMTKRCVDQVFADAGFKPGEGRDQVGVIELHDCFAANELITYPALGLCKIDEAHKMVERGDNTVSTKRDILSKAT
ncbi:hypothetical protein AX16_000614 [Volvariella volvacea WC 439]|nr:hypothetical protein AX16_000614 [Volvariella volvacea WC 439]